MTDELTFESVDVESALYSAYRRAQATVFLGPPPTDEDMERHRGWADPTARRTAALDRHRVVGTHILQVKESCDNRSGTDRPRIIFYGWNR